MTDQPLDIDALMTHAAHLARTEVATRPSTTNHHERVQLKESDRNAMLVNQLVELLMAGTEPDTAVRVLRGRDLA